MKTELQGINGIIVARLSGRLDSSASGEVMDQLNAAVSGGAIRMALNLKNVPFVSSAGLRSVLVPAKLARSLGGELRICEPSKLVEKILAESGFENLVRIDQSEEFSVASLLHP